jgi:hypothetical protein
MIKKARAQRRATGEQDDRPYAGRPSVEADDGAITRRPHEKGEDA